MKSNLKICSKCVLDESVPEIIFDQKGICNYCQLHDVLEQEYPLPERISEAGEIRTGLSEKRLKKIVQQIKKSGQGKKYNCIVGLSGGTDSSFLLYQTVRQGLKPLAVHFDNGWNSEVAVSNIQKICSKLKVELYTYVIDWEEFKDLQISFLKASVPDAEIPTDVGIHSILFKIAEQENIKYILNGHSFRAEGMAPLGWTYMDGLYINDVQKKFGKVKLKTFPNFTLKNLFYYSFIKRIKVIPFLNYINYQKETARKTLTKELNWRYYGGHHHESIYTYFFQSYYLPKKFGIDKRKTELSAMIRSGQISRKNGLKELEKNYEFDPEIINYTLNKLNLSQNDFNEIIKAENKSFNDYSTYAPYLKLLHLPLKISYILGLVPKLLYLKYSVLFR